MDGTDSGSCPVMGFKISDDEPVFCFQRISVYK